jgi:hypothetical protein
MARRGIVLTGDILSVSPALQSGVAALLTLTTQFRSDSHALH